jgi:hypothetical protein
VAITRVTKSELQPAPSILLAQPAPSRSQVVFPRPVRERPDPPAGRPLFPILARDFEYGPQPTFVPLFSVQPAEALRGLRLAPPPETSQPGAQPLILPPPLGAPTQEQQVYPL